MLRNAFGLGNSDLPELPNKRYSRTDSLQWNQPKHTNIKASYYLVSTTVDSSERTRYNKKIAGVE